MEYLPPLFRIVLIWHKQATERSSAEIWNLFRTKVEFTLLPTFSFIVQCEWSDYLKGIVDILALT